MASGHSFGTMRPKEATRQRRGRLLRSGADAGDQGIAIDRSTLAFWVGYAAQELKPLWRRLREILLASAKLCVDETPAPVLDPGRGRTKTGYFWSLSRDDRPWAGPDPPGVVYAYAPGRGAIHGLRLLEGYRAERGIKVSHNTVWLFLRREGLRFKKNRMSPLSSLAPTSRVGASAGDHGRPVSIPGAWSSSTRPGSRPTWPRCADGGQKASDCGASRRTATGGH